MIVADWGTTAHISSIVIILFQGETVPPLGRVSRWPARAGDECFALHCIALLCYAFPCPTSKMVALRRY